ncbi:hypothetical protein QVD99_004927 [Batrachochytrium dendrobatidis]|nr:hypothetical protein QVD99_004927 [Batrachochytrium dendrobatidis]
MSVIQAICARILSKNSLEGIQTASLEASNGIKQENSHYSRNDDSIGVAFNENTFPDLHYSVDAIKHSDRHRLNSEIVASTHATISSKDETIGSNNRSTKSNTNASPYPQNQSAAKDSSLTPAASDSNKRHQATPTANQDSSHSNHTANARILDALENTMWEGSLKSKEYERRFIQQDDFYKESHFVSASRHSTRNSSGLFLPSNASNTEHGALKSTHASLNTTLFSGQQLPDLPQDSLFLQLIKRIDVCRITNRIIACGLPCKLSSSITNHRNHIADLCRFLDTRYPQKYMIWNLAGDTAQGTYSSDSFHHRVLAFPLSKAFHLNIKTLLDFSRSIHAWLNLDPDNVAIVHCTNGLARTGLAIATYLRFADIIPDVKEAFDYFVYRRSKKDRSWVTVSMDRYINYMDHVMNTNGVVPNPDPIRLHHIVMNGIPNFDGKESSNPGIEIYESGKLVFCTHRASSRSSTSITSHIQRTLNSVVFQVPLNTVLLLQRDIQLRIFHTPEASLVTSSKLSSNTKSPVITMVSFSFNSGFMPTSGIIRIGAADLDLSPHDIAERRFPANFTIDIVITDSPQSQARSQRHIPNNISIDGTPNLSYERSLGTSLIKCLSRFVCYHLLKVDQANMEALEAKGYHYVLACYALQQTENNVARAETLAKFLCNEHPLLKATALSSSRRSNTSSYSSARSGASLPHTRLRQISSMPRNTGSLDGHSSSLSSQAVQQRHMVDTPAPASDTLQKNSFTIDTSSEFLGSQLVLNANANPSLDQASDRSADSFVSRSSTISSNHDPVQSVNSVMSHISNSHLSLQRAANSARRLELLLNQSSRISERARSSSVVTNDELQTTIRTSGDSFHSRHTNHSNESGTSSTTRTFSPVNDLNELVQRTSNISLPQSMQGTSEKRVGHALVTDSRSNFSHDNTSSDTDLVQSNMSKRMLPLNHTTIRTPSSSVRLNSLLGASRSINSATSDADEVTIFLDCSKSDQTTPIAPNSPLSGCSSSATDIIIVETPTISDGDATDLVLNYHAPHTENCKNDEPHLSTKEKSDVQPSPTSGIDVPSTDPLENASAHSLSCIKEQEQLPSQATSESLEIDTFDVNANHLHEINMMRKGKSMVAATQFRTPQPTLRERSSSTISGGVYKQSDDAATRRKVLGMSKGPNAWPLPLLKGLNGDEKAKPMAWPTPPVKKYNEGSDDDTISDTRSDRSQTSNDLSQNADTHTESEIQEKIQLKNDAKIEAIEVNESIASCTTFDADANPLIDNKKASVQRKSEDLTSSTVRVVESYDATTGQAVDKSGRAATKVIDLKINLVDAKLFELGDLPSTTTPPGSPPAPPFAPPLPPVFDELDTVKDATVQIEAPPPPPPLAPPPPPPPPLAPPPPPSFKTGVSTSTPSNTAPKIRARAKLHWNEIRNGKNTVWSELALNSTSTSSTLTERSVQLDVKRFEELFCIIPGQDKNQTSSKSKMVQKARFSTFLDIRRANNIAIGLSRFTRRGLNTDDLFTAIRAMNESKLSFDDLITIQGLLPTTDELILVRQYLSSVAKKRIEEPTEPQLPLAPAEAFAVAASKFKHITHQILAFLFKIQLPLEAEEVHSKFHALAEVSRQFCLSENFKILLRTVLQLGNLTNYEYGSGNNASSYRPWMGKEARAIGFKIEGLARLKDVKSADGKWSLMTFLVEMVQDSEFSSVLDISDEFADLTTVRQFDILALVAQVTAMQVTATNLRELCIDDRSRFGIDAQFKQLLTSVLNEADRYIHTVVTQFNCFVNAWSDALQYFGEDQDEYITPCLDPTKRPKKPSDSCKVPGYFYTTLDLFMQGFKSSVIDLRNRREMERKRISREKKAALEKQRRAIIKAEREAAKLAQETTASAEVLNASGSIVQPVATIPFPLRDTIKEDNVISKTVDTQSELPKPAVDRAGEAKAMFKRFSMMPMKPIGLDEIANLDNGVMFAGNDEAAFSEYLSSSFLSENGTGLLDKQLSQSGVSFESFSYD